MYVGWWFGTRAVTHLNLIYIRYGTRWQRQTVICVILATISFAFLETCRNWTGNSDMIISIPL